MKSTTGQPQATKLLLVEAHAITSRALATAFDRDGRFAVLGPTNHEADALELARRHLPDLVLLDIRGVEGPFTLIQAILEASPCSSIAAHAAFYRPGESKAYLELGAKACLLKGIRFSQLASQLHALGPAACRESR